MRDPARIPAVLAALAAAWGTDTDLRLGQFVDNVASAYRLPLRHAEDDAWLAALTDYAAERGQLAGAALAEVEELRAQLADAEARAIRNFVRDGMASDGWMTVHQVRWAIEDMEAVFEDVLTEALGEATRLYESVEHWAQVALSSPDAAVLAAAEWERIAGEWHLDTLELTDQLDEANADLRAVRKQLADREVEVLADQRDAALVAAADEPPGGWAAYAAAWQNDYRAVMRGYMDTLAERDHANRQLALVEAEAEVMADQRDAAQRERIGARAALTAVLDLLEDADLLARARAVAATTLAVDYITNTEADLTDLEDLE